MNTKSQVREHNRQIIREACIKANPEIVENAEIKDPNCCIYPDCEQTTVVRAVRPIRLADIVFTLQSRQQDYIPDYTLSILCQIHWNTRKDDLALQDDECLKFISDHLAA